MKSANRVARSGESSDECGWSVGKSGINLLLAHAIGIRRHPIEALGVVAQGNVAAFAHIGHDRLYGRNRTFATGIGTRQIVDEIGTGSATKIKTVQHEARR